MYKSLLFLLISLSLCAQDKPNIIIILADDLGYADVGFHDYTEADVKTPELDKLASSGTWFSNAYSTSPICSASRLGLSTGRYQQRWGAYYYGEGGLPKEEQTIAEALKSIGYKTMKVGKTHMNKGFKQHPMDHGFDDFLGFIDHSWDFFMLSQEHLDAYKKRAKKAGHKGNIKFLGPLMRGYEKNASFKDTNITDVFTVEAQKFIVENKDESFYLRLSFNAVHTPLHLVPEDLAKKHGIKQPKWDPNASTWEYPLWDPKTLKYNEWYKQVCHLQKTDPYGRLKYLIHLEIMDQAIGKVLKTLDEQQIRDKTLIFFSSDNGGSHQSYANNGHLNAFKYSVMDGALHVPFLVSYPAQLPKANKSDALVSHMDIFATIADLNGLTPKNKLDGLSLIPHLKGEQADVHDYLIWDMGKKKSWAIRQKAHKLVLPEAKQYQKYQLDEQGLVKDQFQLLTLKNKLQLFDLGNDPGETKDLISQMPEKAEAMKQVYAKWRSQMKAPVKGAAPKYYSRAKK